MRRTEPRRLTALSSSTPLTRTGSVKAVSSKRQRQNRTYSVLRREFLTSWPQCQHPLGCRNEATDVHHMRGRVGELLLNTAWWLALCRECHQFATDNPAKAIQVGLSYRRVGAA